MSTKTVVCFMDWNMALKMFYKLPKNKQKEVIEEQDKRVYSLQNMKRVKKMCDDLEISRPHMFHGAGQLTA